MPDLVLLGRFGRAHGVRGEVRVQSFTADPLALKDYGPLTSEDGRRRFVLASLRPGGEVLIARVEGVATREAAEALNGVGLHVPRDRLPPPDDEDEFLLADLVGCRVVDMAGAEIGSVVDVPNYGAGDLVEIRPVGGGPTGLLPFTRAFVPGIDIAARRLTVDAPADLFTPARGAPPEEIP